MTRDVNLVSYLPPFISEYREINTALTAQEPEFCLVWKAADRVLYNEFIATADENGISRFERLLKILPSGMDTLESRRARVQSRWFMALPYTWRMFLKKLAVLCGDNNFAVTKQFDCYRIHLDVTLELFGQTEELRRIIESMIPCNMVVMSENRISCEAAGFAGAAGGVCAVEYFYITNDSQDVVMVNSDALHGGGVVNAVSVDITDNLIVKREDEKLWPNFQS